MGGVAVWYYINAEREFLDLGELELDAVALWKNLRGKPRPVVAVPLISTIYDNVFFRQRYVNRSVAVGYDSVTIIEGWLVVVYGWGPPGILWVLGTFMDDGSDRDRRFERYAQAAADARTTMPE